LKADSAKSRARSTRKLKNLQSLDLYSGERSLARHLQLPGQDHESIHNIVILRSINPTTEQVNAEFPTHSEAEVDSAIERAEQAFGENRRTPFAHRAARLHALADVLAGDRSRFASLLTAEMGKTLTDAFAEIDKCARVCRYYADNGESLLRDRALDSDGGRSFVRPLPLGPVLAVMPWNFPFWQVFRCAAPAIMAGNVVLLKHASNVPGASQMLQNIFEQADFPKGQFQSLLIGPDTAARVLEDSRVRAASVTGSVQAGASVAEVAGSNVKKTVLELGGSDAFIVMPSADIEQAVKAGVQSRAQNNGQSCIAAKRFIVHESVYDEFVEKFSDTLVNLQIGDPTEQSTEIGPLSQHKTRERLDSQVQRLLGHGATRVTGARPRDGKGFFYEPGILADIPIQAKESKEELFGPVAMMFRAKDLGRAIELANDTPYGLASSLWTNDAAEVQLAINELQAGATFVNSLVRSDPRWPFGGIRRSGYGRELSGDGIREFVNRKTVVIENLDAPNGSVMENPRIR